MTSPARPDGARPLHMVAGLVAAVVLVACGGAGVDQSQLDEALSAVAAWLQVDDDGGDTAEAVRRADRLLLATAPIVEARPPIEELTPAQQARFHDALAGLRDSVAAQREVLAACDHDDPGTCLARSDLDPQELAAAVERFQDALEPLGDQPAAMSLAGRNASSRTHSA